MCVYVSCSVMSDSVIPWSVAHQALLSMEFSRQEYWSGCHYFLQGIFLTQGLKNKKIHVIKTIYTQVVYDCGF